jgi:hypothetical protein
MSLIRIVHNICILRIHEVLDVVTDLNHVLNISRLHLFRHHFYPELVVKAYSATQLSLGKSLKGTEVLWSAIGKEY